MKNFLHDKMRWAGMDTRCEVFGLFARDIPQEGLARIDRGRKRQGIIPDSRFPATRRWRGKGCYFGRFEIHYWHWAELSPQPKETGRAKEGCGEECLGSGSGIQTSRCVVRHQVLWGAKGSQRTASGRGSSAEASGLLWHSPGMELWSIGEASDTVHSLIHTITEARLKISAQQPGRRAMRSIDVERAQLVGSLRRQISFVAVRANARLILSRMESHVGQGAGEAAKRRQHVAVLERQERRERQAHAISVIQGKNLLRRGQFLME